MNLTKSLAGALGPSIRVNAVAPGWMVGEWMCTCVLLKPGASLTPDELLPFLRAEEIATHKPSERLET